MLCSLKLIKQLIIHKIMKNINKFNYIKITSVMTKSRIKNKKLLVDLMVENFKSIPSTAITFSNIKKK